MGCVHFVPSITDYVTTVMSGVTAWHDDFFISTMCIKVSTVNSSVRLVSNISLVKRSLLTVINYQTHFFRRLPILCCLDTDKNVVYVTWGTAAHIVCNAVYFLSVERRELDGK